MVVIIVGLGAVIGVGAMYYRLGNRVPIAITAQGRVEAALKAKDCPASVRSFPEGAYTGPLIDAHIHIPPIPDGPIKEGFRADNDRPALGLNVVIDDYVCMMQTEGTKAILAFFPVWEPLEHEFIQIAKQAQNKYPGKFIPFIMPPQNDDKPDGFPTVDAQKLNQFLSIEPSLFAGYGEIGLYERKRGAKALLPNSTRLMEIYPVVRNYKLVVYLHLGEGQQASFEQAVSANPDITFIWHGDQLIPKRDGIQDLSAIETILSNHSNVVYGIDELYGDVFLLREGAAKQDVINHFANPQPLLDYDVATWKSLIERHPDQVIWGTDRGWNAVWSLDGDLALTLNDYSRLFIAKLDPSVQSKFAYQNAERIFGLK